MGIFFAVLSGIMVFVQGPVLRRALKGFSEDKLVIIGSLILGTNFVGYFCHVFSTIERERHLLFYTILFFNSAIKN
jgi:hypothetical protein